MHPNHTHWEGSGRAGSDSKIAPDDPFENHQFNIHPGHHKGGVHGHVVHEHNPGDHTAEDMSRAGADSLKHLGG